MNTIGNGEAKELISVTDRHELRWGGVVWNAGGKGGIRHGG